MAASPFAHDQPAVGSVWKRSKLSSQDMQGTNSSPIPSWAQVTQRPSVLCQVAVLFWRQPYTQKQVPLQNAVRGCQVQNPVQNSMDTCLSPVLMLWGNMVPWCLLHHFGQDQVAAWASVSKMTAEPLADGAVS